MPLTVSNLETTPGPFNPSDIVLATLSNGTQVPVLFVMPLAQNLQTLASAQDAGGGLGGTAVSIADGNDAAEGFQADAAVIDPATAASVTARLAGLQQLHYTAHHATSVVTIAAGVGSIGARTTRRTCQLFCPTANTDDVLIDGVFAVPKGVVFPVDTVDAISLTGAHDGDVVNVLETYN